MEKQAVIRTLPEAMRLIKEMNLESTEEWTGDYREAARDTIANVLKDQMEERIASHLSPEYLPVLIGTKTLRKGPAGTCPPQDLFGSLSYSMCDNCISRYFSVMFHPMAGKYVYPSRTNVLRQFHIVGMISDDKGSLQVNVKVPFSFLEKIGLRLNTVAARRSLVRTDVGCTNRYTVSSKVRSDV